MIARPVRSAIAFFCESIREEKRGGTSYIGQMPVNLNLAPSSSDPPERIVSLVPSLGIVVLINVPVDDPVGKIAVRGRGDWRDAISFDHGIEADTIRAEQSVARAQANQFVSFWMKIELSPFPAAPGRFEIVVGFDDDERLAGELFYRSAPPQSVATG